MSKLSKIAATAAALPVLAFATPVFAGSAGTLGGGDNYVAKNLTTGSAYSNNTSATCNDVVQYSMQLTNTQYGSLNNVTLKASLPSQGGVSTATATTDLGGTTGTSDTTTVTVTSGATQSLVNGSTKLYDSAGHVVKTLPDTIASNGVNIGTLVGSTTEFVNFQAKLNCAPAPKQIQVCDLTTKKVVTINESDFDSSKHSKDMTQCQTTTPPAVLPNTGAGSVVGIAAGAIVAGFAVSRVYLSRKLARSAE